MQFEVVGQVKKIETIAVVSSIRILPLLRNENVV
jgi:hypothetical protein